MRYLNLMLIGLLLLGLQGCASPGVKSTDTTDTVWIDVRTAEEYDSGHVPGAVNIPYDDMTRRIGELQLSPEQPIYLYCGSGRRAGIALETLSGLGYTEVTNMGGLDDARAWLQAQPETGQP